MEDETSTDQSRLASRESESGRRGAEPETGAAVDMSAHRRHLILGTMMLGTGAACISQSMMIAALPTIMEQFAVDATLGQLLTTSYIFALGLISAVSAFLVNRVNAKTLFFTAIGIFIVGCAAALVAPNYWLLLASRLLQAGGAGILLPLIQVVALSVYPKSEYGKAMGIVGIIIGFAPAIGPTISGFLIDVWGWHSVFVVLGSIALAVALAAIPLLPRDIVEQRGHRDRFDAISTLLYVGGLCACMVGITLVESSGASPVAGAVLAASVVVLTVFARRELRADEPLLKLSCLGNGTFAVSVCLVLVSQVAFMAGSIMVPLFVQDVQMDSATVSGLVILPGALLLGILNPVTGRYLDRHGPIPLVIVGGVMLVIGTAAFAFLDPQAPEWLVMILYGVRTVGVACLMMPMTAYGSAALPAGDLAQATAIITSFRQIFGSLSVSVLIAIMAANSSNALGIDAHGFGVSFLVLSAVIALGCVIGALILRRQRKTSC